MIIALINKVIDWILRRKTLRGTLYIMMLFFVKELSALSKGEEIVIFLEKIQNRYSNNEFLDYVCHIGKIFFAEGSRGVLFVSTAVILLLVFLIWLYPYENRNPKVNPYISLFVLLGFSGVLLWSVFNLDPIINQERFVHELNNKLQVLDKVTESRINEIKSASPDFSAEVHSYEDLIRLTNSSLNQFLDTLSRSFSENEDYSGLALVLAQAGYGKSHFIENIIKKKFPEWKIGVVKTRQKLLSGHNLNNSTAGILGFNPKKKEDLTIRTENGEKKVLGELYDYTPNLEKIIDFYQLTNVDALLFDDLDEISLNTLQKYLAQINETDVKEKLENIKLIVLLSRPEAFSPILSRYDFSISIFNFDIVYGINEVLEKVSLNNEHLIRLRIKDWAEWYGPNKIGENITEQEREELYGNLILLLEMHPFLYCQLGISKDSDYLLRKIHDKQSLKPSMSENDIKKILFEVSLKRNSESHNRPVLKSEDAILYEKVLMKIAYRYATEDLVKNNGWFVVQTTDAIDVEFDGKLYKNIIVKDVLYRSGLISIRPSNQSGQQFSFDPIWFHHYLVEKYVKTLAGNKVTY